MKCGRAKRPALVASMIPTSKQSAYAGGEISHAISSIVPKDCAAIEAHRY
jgi:hypothetical protein